MEKIPPLRLEGTIDHFSGWMSRNLAIRRGVWGEFGAKKFEIRYVKEAHTSKREAWIVLPFLMLAGGAHAEGRKWATILAVEEFPGKTIVEFIDGLYYCHDTRWFVAVGDTEKDFIKEYDYGETIGKDFLRIAQEIKDTYWSQYSEPNQEEVDLKPWEKIPDVGWYREAVRLWRENFSAREIGSKLCKDEQTIRNKIAELRGLYGEEIVPYRRK